MELCQKCIVNDMIIRAGVVLKATGHKTKISLVYARLPGYFLKLCSDLDITDLDFMDLRRRM